MMVKDPVVAPGAVGANAMAAPMVKVVLLGCASGGEEPGDEQRNDQKSKHRILLLVRFEVKDDNAAATRNLWRTDRILHDRRRTLRTRKRAESEHRSGGAVGDRARSRQDGLAATAASVLCIR